MEWLAIPDGSMPTEAAADEENETAESESTSAEAAVDEEKETAEPESSSAEEKEQSGANEPDPSETDDDAFLSRISHDQRHHPASSSLLKMQPAAKGSSPGRQRG